MTLMEFLQTPYGIAASIALLILVGLVVRWIVKRMTSSAPSAPSVPPTVDTLPPTTGDEAPAATVTGEPTAHAPPTGKPTAAEQPFATEVEGAPETATMPAVEDPTVEDAEPTADVVALEVPESVPSRMERLRGRLARSGSLGKALLSVLSRGDLSAADWEELEDTLLVADVGLEATEELMDALRTRVKVAGVHNADEVKSFLRDELLTLVGPDMDRSMNLTTHTTDEGQTLPATVLMVGVNGTGKTTTVGKLSRLLVAEGKTVMLGAADTFRAAAADQLCTWGERVGVEVVRSDREGADPASVAFDAVKAGKDAGVDVVLVDTAGRLQNKSTLMEELGKIKRVMERQAPTNEVLLVLDATTGQNGMRQAEVFAEAVGVTGIVLTKLDGSAKGGIVVSVQRALGVPVKYVGLGEGVDDLAPFDPEAFVDAIING